MFVRFNNSTAPEPVRATNGSVGYDLSIIGIKDEGVNNVTYFHTGWSVRPPAGYFAVIHSRSSLHKTGFTLANSTGIIDVDYQGELIVALYKFGTQDYKFDFPFRAVQVVFMPLPYMGPIKCLGNIEGELLDEEVTERGAGGFGSTGH